MTLFIAHRHDLPKHVGCAYAWLWASIHHLLDLGLPRRVWTTLNLPEPEELAEDIVTNLQAALASFQEIANGLEEA